VGLSDFDLVDEVEHLLIYDPISEPDRGTGSEEQHSALTDGK